MKPNVSSDITGIPVKDAVRDAGGVTALAERIGSSRNSIYLWLRADQDLPELFEYRFRYGHKRPAEPVIAARRARRTGPCSGIESGPVRTA